MKGFTSRMGIFGHLLFGFLGKNYKKRDQKAPHKNGYGEVEFGHNLYTCNTHVLNVASHSTLFHNVMICLGIL